MDSRSILTKLASMEPGIMGLDSFKRSAVLIPLVEIDGETHILFEVRSMQLRRQPGDICFPGGRIEADDPTTQACAVRETAEELGISEGSIQDVIPIDYVVSDMGRIIYPFVGKIPDLDQITPSTMEVEEIFTVPLSYLQQTTPEVYRVNFKVSPEENFPFHLIVGGENYNWQMRHIEELFYLYEDQSYLGINRKDITAFFTLD